MNSIHKEIYKNHTIEILPDLEPLNPREISDNFGTFYALHRRYTLGDSHDFTDARELTEYATSDKNIFLPVYMYDHSGISLSTSPFSCPYDSGQVGWIFVSKEKVCKEFQTLIVSTSLKRKVIRDLKAEILEYSRYLSGECYGFKISDSKGSEVDSCWGYYGSDYPIQNAKEIIDAIETKEI